MNVVGVLKFICLTLTLSAIMKRKRICKKVRGCWIRCGKKIGCENVFIFSFLFVLNLNHWLNFMVNFRV